MSCPPVVCRQCTANTLRPGRKRGLRDFGNRKLAILGRESTCARRQDAIQIDFNVVVVRDHQPHVAELAGRDFEHAPQPNFFGVPFRPNDDAARPRRAKTAESLAPRRVVELGQRPACARLLLEAEPPCLPLLLRGRRQRDAWLSRIQPPLRKRTLADLPLKRVELAIGLLAVLVELGHECAMRGHFGIRADIAVQVRSVTLRPLERCEDRLPGA